ncbi:MAG TPA: DNA-binding protein [Gammaproteobacteria bacterium]|nr:DNA-binding protein [Gammaproteobacteria bacterium]HRA42863.1 DNA-binding protein [Gammaproteobacteria bacterium]
MSRISITAKDVFQASEALIAAGKTPTQGRVREYLGRGSKGTIHKYLKQWKQTCFEKGFHPHGNPATENKVSSQEKQGLEKLVQKQILDQERLSTEMLETERQLTKAKEQNRALTTNFEESKFQYAILETAYKNLQEAFQVLSDSQENIFQTLLKDKNQHIGSLRQELKELNEASLMAVKDIGYQADEALIVEKLKTIHLSDQVHALQKTVEDLKKELLKVQVVKNRENLLGIKKD